MADQKKPNILIIWGFRDFPPRQKAASFTIEQASQKMEASATGR